MLVRILRGLLPRAGAADIRQAMQTVPSASADKSSGEAEFVHSILRDFLIHVHRFAQNNYDHARFDPEIPDQSGIFDLATHAHYLQFFMEHCRDFHTVFQHFADAESRELYRRLILFRLLGHTHVAIHEGFTWNDEEGLYRKAGEFDSGESPLEASGLFGKLHHFEGIPLAGSLVSLDCWAANIVYTAFKRQYYLLSRDVEVAPKAGDVVFDVGACFGDTAVHFAQSVGNEGHVYAFDPLPAHRKVIDYNVAQNRLARRITVEQLAVGDRSSDGALGESPLRMDSRTAHPGFSMCMAPEEFPTTTLDDFVRERNIDRVDFIKMDIEGYELPALMGAEEVIGQFRPNLAISLYHRPEDYFAIPLWLAGRFPEYELRLEHYTLHREETVLFASPAR